MKRHLWIASLVVLTAALVGCSDSFEKIAEDQKDLNRDYVAVLKTIKDEATAREAVPKIEALASRGEAIKARFKALGEPTAEDVERALKAFDDSSEKVEDPTMEIIRLQQNREVSLIIKPAVTKYQAAEF